MGGYNALEKVQLAIITLMLVAILFASIYFKPDWWAVLSGTFTPRIPDYGPWIFEKYPEVATRPPWVEVTVYIEAIGGGPYDYIGYIGMLREKNWGLLGLPNLAQLQQRIYELEEKGERIPLSEEEEDVRIALAWTKAPAIDSVVSFASVIIFASGFMIGGARLLHSEQLVPSGLKLLEYQAQFLTRIHRWLLPLYDMGVFLAIAGTVYGGYEVYTRTAFECLRAVFPGLRKITVKQVRPWVCLYVGVVGMFLMWMTRLLPKVKLIDLPTPAGIIGGVMTCGLWCLAMIWTDRKYLPKPYQMRGWLVFLNVIAGIGMTGMGLKAWWDYGVDDLHGGWTGYIFLAGIVVLSMVTTAIISSYYRRKGTTTAS